MDAGCHRHKMAAEHQHGSEWRRRAKTRGVVGGGVASASRSVGKEAKGKRRFVCCCAGLENSPTAVDSQGTKEQI